MDLVKNSSALFGKSFQHHFKLDALKSMNETQWARALEMSPKLAGSMAGAKWVAMWQTGK